MDAGDDEAVKLAMQLINVESLSGHEQPMATVLKEWLEKREWIVDLQEVPPQKGTANGQVRHNVYARRAASTAEAGPRVLFNSHIDTVCDDEACLIGAHNEWDEVGRPRARSYIHRRVLKIMRRRSPPHNQSPFAFWSLSKLGPLPFKVRLVYVQERLVISA